MKVKQHLMKTAAVCCGLLAALTSCNNGEVVVPDSEKKLDHLIFEEICYTGTYNEKWKQLIAEDQYLKITNPTDKTFYLDGMALAQSGLGNRSAVNLNKGTDFRETHFGASILIAFPGKAGGKQHPILPGQSIFVAKVAYDFIKGDHMNAHPNSYDLSKVDYEWATPQQIENEDYEENLQVPNMVAVYPIEDAEESDGLPKELIPRQGVLALIQIPDTVTIQDLLHKEQYLWHTGWVTDQKIEGGVVDHGGGHEHDGNFNNVVFLKIPNAWVVDAVQISPQKEFGWNVVPNLDRGSTGVFTYASDRLRQNARNFHGLALFRKHDGKKFVDTDNSEQDFEIRKASGAQRSTSKPQAE